MFDTPPPYHTYILRFWTERREDEPQTWRFVLEDPDTKVRMGFADLPSLIRFLEQQTNIQHGSK